MLAKRRSKKESTLFSGTSNVDGRLVYTETGEPVFRVTPLVAVYRDTLTSERRFSPDDALKIIDRYYKKKHSECIAYITDKRLILTKRKPSDKPPFRTWVAYTEIVDIRRGVKKLDAFVISINSQQTRKRYYEVYKCKSKEEAEKFEDLIKRALEQPDGILQASDLGYGSSYSTSDDPNLPRNLVYHQFTPSLVTLREDDKAEKEAECETEYQPVYDNGVTETSAFDGQSDRNGGEYCNTGDTVINPNTGISGLPPSHQPQSEYQNVHTIKYRLDSPKFNPQFLDAAETTADLPVQSSQSAVIMQPTPWSDMRSLTPERTIRCTQPREVAYLPNARIESTTSHDRLCTAGETNHYGLRHLSFNDKRVGQSFSVRQTHEIKTLPGVTYFRFVPNYGFQPSDTGPVYIYSLAIGTQPVNKQYY